jgi:RNA polymerase sigma-70 factor, ECF subfamily
VLVLRDVLRFRTTEVADMLDTGEASVKGALQRIRATLERGCRPPTASARRAQSPRERELIGRFADAYASAAIARPELRIPIEGIVRSLTLPK